MLQRLRNYFAPEACAKRQRSNERKILTAELRSITAHRVYGYSREVAILKRLRVLDYIDAPRPAVERRVPFLVPAFPPKLVVEDDACLPESWLHGVASEARP